MGWRADPVVGGDTQTAPQWQSSPAVADQDGDVPAQAQIDLTPDNWLESAANDIQAKQEQRVQHKIAPLNADEQMQIQDRYRVAAGMEPVHKRALERYQEMRKARTTDSDWQNYLNNIANTTGSFMAGITEVGYKLSDLTGVTENQAATFAQQQKTMTESLAPGGGVSGFGGRLTGNVFNMLLLGGGAKTPAGTPLGGRMLAQLPTAGAFGVSSAGSAITDMEQRRAKGENISGGQMFAAATLNAIIETGIEMFGLEMVSMAGRALGREALTIIKAMRTGSATEAGKAFLKAIGNKKTLTELAKAGAGGSAEEIATQIGQNLVNKYVAGVQNQAIMEGVGEAALQGGLMPLLVGGVTAAGRGLAATPADTNITPDVPGKPVSLGRDIFTPLAHYSLARSGGALGFRTPGDYYDVEILPTPPRGPLIPADRGRTYSQPGPEAPRIIVPFPSASQVTPEQTLELIGLAGRDAPQRTLIPGGGPLVPSGGALVQYEAPPTTTPQPTPEGMIPVYRGVNTDGLSGLRKTEGVYGEGVYFYDNATDARAYAGPGGGIITGYVPKDQAEIHGKVVLLKDPSSFERRGTVPTNKTLDLTTSNAEALVQLASAPTQVKQDITIPPLPPVLPRPVSIVTEESQVHQTPDGSQVNAPHVTYDTADKATFGQELGEQIAGPVIGENLWVRPTADQTNDKRTLLVLFSTTLINADRVKTSTDAYYDRLYANRPGYSRPSDFWELPQWMGVAAHNLPNTDVYVVRNIQEAQAFLGQAKYGEIAFSALDVNSKFIQDLIGEYNGKVAIGGYTNMAPFQGRANVRVFDKISDWIGPKFKDGTDYRHFRATEVQPRLQLSTGCLHKCGFCTMPRMITKTTPEGVAQQIKSFGDLNYRLVYLNDKTFGQADNYTYLTDIHEQIKAKNPNFEGFIIQTTASQMTKFTPEFLAKSGIAYVELGVESYNDKILKPLHKPANEKIIDQATQVIRENGLKLIPNIIVGIPDETAETYEHTLDYLKRNADVISHVNVNNLGIYVGTELFDKIGRVIPSDTDQNTTVKSFHKNPALHQAAYEAFTAFGAHALDVPTGVATPPDDGTPAEPRQTLAERLASDETGAIPLSAMTGAAMKAVAPIAHLVNDITGEMAFFVSHIPAGKALVRGLDNISTKADTLSGKVANPAADADAGLTFKDRAWLHGHDAQGYGNFQRIVEDTPSGRLTAPNPQVQAVIDADQLMVDLTGQEAMRIGVQAIAPNGEVIDFKQASNGRYLRNMTPDAFMALHQGSGPLFDAIAAVVSRDNHVDIATAGTFLRQWVGPEAVRKVGQIERLRAIKFLPVAVEVSGSWVNIQETDSYRHTMDNMRRQAKRIYFIEEFGQNVKGRPTRVETLRAEFQKDGGRVAEFDDLITVFEERPYARVFANPRAPLSRAIRVVDSIVATEQTSLSAIPQLGQTFMLVPKYTSLLTYLKAVGQSLRHPKMTTAQLAAMGAMNRAVIGWTLRPGHGPEDVVRIFKGVVARYTGLEALSQFNNKVAGVAFARTADSWLQNGIQAGDIAVARDLRLTEGEVAAINAGKMTQGIYNKIVQNGVKITQFITENPHRRSKMQNIPVLNSLIAYNSYSIGTARAVMRTGRETALALKSGDPRQVIAAASRIVMLLAGTVGSGTLSLLLRRAVKGQELLRPEEDVEDIVKKALWEASILGPAQRIQDAYDYSGGSTEKAMVGVSPKLAAMATVLSALYGAGRWGELSPRERAGKAISKNMPLIRAANAWIERATYPQMELYRNTRSLAAAYKPKTGLVPEIAVNPYYYHVHQAILKEDPKALDLALDQFKTWATSQGWDDEETNRRLRGALNARRPVAFDLATYREFMASLSPEKRQMVMLTQAQYTEAIDFLTLSPEEQAARKGDLEPLRGLLERGLIGQGKAREIVMDARKTELQRQFSGANFTDAMRVWATALPQERTDLQAQLLEKAETAIRTRPADQQKILDQLEKAGVRE